MEAQQQAAAASMVMSLGKFDLYPGAATDHYRMENLDLAPVTQQAFAIGDSPYTDRLAMAKLPPATSHRMAILDPYKHHKENISIRTSDTHDDGRFLKSMDNAQESQW